MFPLFLFCLHFYILVFRVPNTPQMFVFLLHYLAIFNKTEMERQAILSLSLSLSCYVRLDMFKTTILSKEFQEPLVVSTSRSRALELLNLSIMVKIDGLRFLKFPVTFIVNFYRHYE